MALPGSSACCPSCLLGQCPAHGRATVPSKSPPNSQRRAGLARQLRCQGPARKPSPLCCQPLSCQGAPLRHPAPPFVVLLCEGYSELPKTALRFHRFRVPCQDCVPPRLCQLRITADALLRQPLLRYGARPAPPESSLAEPSAGNFREASRGQARDPWPGRSTRAWQKHGARRAAGGLPSWQVTNKHNTSTSDHCPGEDGQALPPRQVVRRASASAPLGSSAKPRHRPSRFFTNCPPTTPAAGFTLW